MPLLDQYEVCVSLDEVVNLELLRKGVYRFKIRAEGGDTAFPPLTSAAAPVRLTSFAHGQECEGSDTQTEAGYIDERAGAYYSRSVYFRYSNESFDLGESVIFPCVMPKHTPHARLPP
ncbi:hypothetical protein EON62_06440, partial [archaeon]